MGPVTLGSVRISHFGMGQPNDPKKDIPPAAGTEIDDHYIDEWVKYGFHTMRGYLDRHRAFQDYCDRREGQDAGTAE